MAKVTRSGRILKEDDGNSSKKREVGGKTVNSDSNTTDTSGLRRSTRETPSKKQRTLSPSSARKSEKHLAQTPPTQRKSERVENLKMPSSLRRSERGEKNRALSLLASKTSEKGSSSLGTEDKKEKGEKSEKQQKLSSKDQKGKLKKGLSARRYRALLLPQPQNVKVKESGITEVESGGHSSGRKGEEVRGEDVDEGCERDLEGSSSHSGEPAECSTRQHDEIQPPDASRKRRPCLEEAYETNNRGISPVSEHGDSSPQSSHNGDVVIAEEAIGDADRMQIDTTARENLQEPDLVDSTSEGRSLSGGCGLERTDIGSKRKRLDMDSNVAAMEDGESTADAVSSSQSGNKNNNFLERCATCSKRRRVNCDTENYDICSCYSERNLDLCSTSPPEEICEHAAFVRCPQNGDVLESCIQKDGAEKDIHLISHRSKDNTDLEGGELLGDGQRKVVHDEIDQSDLPARTEISIPLEEDEGGLEDAALVRCPQNGDVLESCIQKDGAEKDVHLISHRSKDNTDLEGDELLGDGQRKVVHDETDETDLLARSEISIRLEENEGGLEAANSRGLTEECGNNDQLKDSSLDPQLGSESNVCVICKLGGKILCCDGEGCKKSYHLKCLDPPLEDVPPGVWHCLCCVMKKIESGVHSVSGGVESILDAKEVELSESEGVQKQYLVKYKNLAHVHNRWIPESQLHLESPMLVAKFKKNQEVRWKSEWAVPHRLLLKRLLMSKKQRNEYLGRHNSNFSNCYYEWFVKWSGLGYEHATWELENEPFLRSPGAMTLIRDYESRRERAKVASDPTRADKVLQERRGMFSKLLELPGQGLHGLDNDHLFFVNKLREYWHKGQNAVVMEDQERVIKVVLFVLALQPIVRRPFLIISNSSALSVWEAEFLRLAPSVNVVVYSGSRGVRESIRKLEFYEEGGCTMFQVLLSPPEAIVEDLEVLKCFGWETIIVDECQCSRVSKHFEHIKTLITDFKLLLVSGPVKESMVEYLNLLSFVDSGFDRNGSHNLKIDSNNNIDKLKERFAQFVACERKADSSKFVEFWVPVRLSNVQLEQYCATLLSNSTVLRSCSKTDTVEALRDVLISTRKCCDHPYLVDPSLQSLLTKGLSAVEYLDVGVNACGKLQVLDNTLSEIKKRGLRALILFQPITGSGTSLGDILDDFLRQRFGPDSYERVSGGLVMSKKHAAMNKFNDKERGRFVFLLETRACLPSIKLSSVDIVILYDSDWNPLSDLRALQRITIDPQYEQLKVFRLFSFCTLEEKVLILAKQDMTLDSNVQNINRTITHMLLKWGASYLFKELDEFHGSTLLSSSIVSPEQSLMSVVHEILAQLPQDAGSSNTIDSSTVLQVKQIGGAYSRDISLPGELEMQLSDEELPHVFWTRLLDRRSPQWRYLSTTCQRVRKKVQYFDESSKKLEVGSDDVTKKRKKVVNCTIDPKPHKLMQENKRKCVNKEGASDIPAGLGSQFEPSSTAQMDAVHYRNVNEISDVPDSNMVESEERRKLRESQKNLHTLLKPEMLRLCEILRLPEDVKEMTGKFLEYIMNNHNVSKNPETIFQAFQISLCWAAASLLKHKISHKETLALAEQHLNFECKETEAESVYIPLRKMLKKFFRRVKNVTKLSHGEDPSRTTNDASDQPELEEGEIRGSPQSLHYSDQHASANQQVTDFEKANGSPNNEISMNITLVKRIHSKRMKKLSELQMAEYQEFLKKSDEEKANLDKKHKYESAIIRKIHTQIPVRVEKLHLVDEEFKKKVNELNYRMEMKKKKLESTQQAAMNEEKRLKSHWLLEAKSGRPVDSFSTLPPSYTGFRWEDMDPSKQVESPLKATSVSGHSSEEQITDRTGLLRPGEMQVAEAPSTVQHEPVEGAMPTESPDFVVQSNFQCSEYQSNHSNLVLPPAVQVQLLPHTDPPSEPLSSNQSSDHEDSASIPAVQLQLQLPSHVDPPSEPLPSIQSTNHDASVLPPAVQLQLPPSTDPSSDSLPSNQLFNHDISVLPPVVQFQLAPPTDPSSEPLPSNLSSNHDDVSVLSPAAQLQLPQLTNPPSEPLLSNQISNRGASDHPPAVQLQLPALTDPSSDPLASNQSSTHGVSVLSPAEQLQLPPPTDSPSDPLLTNQISDTVQLQLPAPTDSSSVPVPSKQSSDHNVSAPLPAVQLQASPQTSSPSEPLPSNHDVSVHLPSVQLQVLPPTDPPSELVVSNQASNHGASVLTPAVQLQLPGPTDPSSEPLPSNQSNHEVLPPAVQLQLPPTADPHSQHNLPIAHACVGIEHGVENDEGQNTSEQSRVPTQPRVEDQVELVNIPVTQPGSQLDYDIQLRQTTSQQAEVPTLPPPADHHTELLSQVAISQPDTMFQLPMSTERPLGGSGTRVPDGRSTGVVPDSSNYPVQPAPVASRMSQPLPHPDPLSNELARIRKEEDQVVKVHEDLRMRINSDFEKEMEEIRQKYNKLRQDADTALAQKKKALEANFNKVFMNRMLAEVFRFKCSDTRAAGPPGMQQGPRPGVNQQQLFQPSSHQSAQRSPLVPAVGAPIAPPAASPPPLVVHNSSALISSSNMVVRSHCPSTTVSYQGGGGDLRAPAPHLQPFRPSTSVSIAPIHPPPLTSVAFSSQPSISNPGASSLMVPQHTTPLVSSYAAGSLNRTHQSESGGVSRNSAPIFEMMMRDFHNGAGANSPNLLSPIPSFDPSDLLEPQMQQQGSLWTPPAPSGLAADVVCLSDDD